MSESRCPHCEAQRLVRAVVTAFLIDGGRDTEVLSDELTANSTVASAAIEEFIVLCGSLVWELSCVVANELGGDPRDYIKSVWQRHLLALEQALDGDPS